MTIPRMRRMLQGMVETDQAFEAALREADKALVLATRAAIRTADPENALERCWLLEESWAALLKEVDGSREMLENLAAVMALAEGA